MWRSSLICHFLDQKETVISAYCIYNQILYWFCTELTTHQYTRISFMIQSRQTVPMFHLQSLSPTVSLNKWSDAQCVSGEEEEVKHGEGGEGKLPTETKTSADLRTANTLDVCWSGNLTQTKSKSGLHDVWWTGVETERWRQWNDTNTMNFRLRLRLNKLVFIVQLRKVTSDAELWVYLHTCTVSPADPGPTQTQTCSPQTGRAAARLTLDQHNQH